MAAHPLGAPGEQHRGFGAPVDNRHEDRGPPQARPDDQVAKIGVEPVVAIVAAGLMRLHRRPAAEILGRMMRGMDGVHDQLLNRRSLSTGMIG
jgi:hypothetical protein